MINPNFIIDFIFIISCLFTLRFVFFLVVAIFTEKPSKETSGIINITSLGLAVSYILTYIKHY